jgi:hypothetical protein
MRARFIERVAAAASQPDPRLEVRRVFKSRRAAEKETPVRTAAKAASAKW